MVSLAVLGVLTGLAAPSLGRTLAQQRAGAQAQAFMGGLRLARAVALQRGEPVTLCARDPAVGQGPACVPGHSADWAAGWLIFVDRSSPGGSGALGPDDQLLRQWGPDGAGALTGAAPGTRSAFRFTAAGVSLDAAAHVDFAPRGTRPVGSGVGAARRVCISKQGRARLLDAGQAACD